MDSEDEDVVIYAGVEHTWVCVANAESEVNEDAAKGIIPLSPSLFKAVERFPQPLDKAATASCFVPRGLLHEDLLVIVKLPIEIGTIEVKRLDFPIVARGVC
jgi:hypothetical protein